MNKPDKQPQPIPAETEVLRRMLAMPPDPKKSPKKKAKKAKK